MNDDDMLVGFLEEAREHLSTIEPDLLVLESDPNNTETINRLFRSVHSIKGGAGFFGLDRLSQMAHVMENLMSKVRNGQITLEQPHIDGLLAGLDQLNKMIADSQNSNDFDITAEKVLLEQLAEGKPAVVAAPEPVAAPVAAPAAAPVAAAVPVAAPAPVAQEFIEEVSEFEIPQKELDWVTKHQMNLYAVSVYLNRDIMSKGKTPYEFISDLEELGRFIDSYLDTENAHSLGDGGEDDLRFTFVFASIMDPVIAAEGLTVSQDYIQHLKLEDIVDRKLRVVHQVKAPVAVVAPEPIAAPAPVAVPEPVAAPVAVVEAPPEAAPALPEVVPNTEVVQAPARKGADHKKLKNDESIRVGVGKLNKLVDLAGELVLVRNQLLQAGEKQGKREAGFASILASLNIVTTELQEEILNTRMQAVQTVFGKFPRLIRELGRSLGKDINLITEGGEVELDKTVLEALSDPLTHMIRNTADHGIEGPDERKKAGKPPQGKLLLKAYHESGQVIIEVSDDGRGIDADKIAAGAYKKGLITEEDMGIMSEQEKVNLIFLPGFSTAQQVSSVSGRGVGMDVVRSNIEQISGTVNLSSKLGQGTTLKLTLPLTMAIVSCLIVESEDQRFAIPQVNLEELVMLKSEDFHTMLGHVQGRQVLKLRGELLPLVSLAEGLGIDERKSKAYRNFLSQLGSSASEKKAGGKSESAGVYHLEDWADRSANKEAVRVLIISVGITKVGVVVDSIVGSEEIVVKPMPEYLKQLTSFSGATILGDGRVAMILDTLGFVQNNQLSMTEQRVQTKGLAEHQSNLEETQSLLVFDNGTSEQFAITIPLIQRVDEINQDQLQKVSDKEYLEYRGEQMRVLRLEDHLDISKPEVRGDRISMIIPKETRTPVGLLINRVIDTKTMLIDVTEGSIHGPGILGSTLIDGKITLLLDLYAILEAGEPDSLHKTNFTAETVKSSRILVIEDTPLFQTIVREYLTSVGFEVDVEENGRLGLDAIERTRYDLVLCDIEMPVMDGFDVIRSLRADPKHKDLPVVALTSLDDEKLIQEGLKAGFNEWMIKLDKERMLKTVNDYLS